MPDTAPVTDTDRLAERLAILSAVDDAMSDLPRLVAVLADAEDRDDALSRLRAAYGIGRVEARAVLDCPVSAFTRARRVQVRAEIETLRDGVAGRWDPPLEVQAVATSPTTLVLELDDGPRVIQGADADACLHALVQAVHELVAVPRRRRVRAVTGLPDGPASVLVDPTGNAQFAYPDDGQEPTVTR